MWLIILSLSPHNQNLLFCCIFLFSLLLSLLLLILLHLIIVAFLSHFIITTIFLKAFFYIIIISIIYTEIESRQFVTLPIVQMLLPVTFAYSLSSEAVVMRQLRRWKRLWRRSLICSHKRTSMGPWRSCWNGTTSALRPEEITSKGTRVSCVYYQ